MRILLGLTEIAGFYKNLKKGFLLNDVDCELIELTENPFNYGGFDDPIFIIPLIRWFSRKRFSKNIFDIMMKPIWLSAIVIFRFFLLVWALFRYDVFIFGLHSTFFRLKDLRILKLFNKKVVMIHNGSDSRPPYLGKLVINDNPQTTQKSLIKATKKKKRAIKEVYTYSDFVVNHSATSYFDEKPFLQFLALGIPYIGENGDSNKTNSKKDINHKGNSAVRILHSPSTKSVKGTPEIRECINNLKKRGYDIDYIEIVNMPNKVVIEEIKKCDFVIDQMYSDTPMATFATEAAYYGKPAVVGGYYSQYIRNDISIKYIPPSCFCLPEEIEFYIEMLINNELYRKKLGQKSMDFVRKEWHPKAVADKYLKIINKEAEKDWWFNPLDMQYPFGGCLNKKRIRIVLQKMLKGKSDSVLQLDDKRKIKEALLSLLK